MIQVNLFGTPFIIRSIIIEFADNGDLFQKIIEHQKSNTQFNEEEIWRILIQTVRGLRALHDLKILHRDMKVMVET
jgi:NIMA (never in mitosis gene a)-related kinase